jgi:myosin heavy subunit
LNALTKAFVVVVTILSVILVALVIPFAARVDDYASQYEQMKQDRNTQLALAQEAATKVRNAIAAKGSELETALESISSLTAELDRANNDAKALEAKLDQAQLTIDRNSAAMEITSKDNQNKSDQLSKLNEQLQTHIATIAELQSERADLSQVLIDERGKVRRLSDNFMRIQEENKALQQQLLEKTALLTVAMEELEVLKQGAEERVADKTTVRPPKGVVIRGSVTKIDQPAEGITFVQVNVGTRDLVKEGMEFTVHRGDEFVGKIEIASVDTAASVGQVTLSEGSFEEGDKVRAGGR